MSKQFKINPKLDFVIERFIDAPTRLVWAALTKPEHLKEWYMPKAYGRVARAEMDVRPGGILSIDIAGADGHEVPNLGCILEVIPMERLVRRVRVDRLSQVERRPDRQVREPHGHGRVLERQLEALRHQLLGQSRERSRWLRFHALSFPHATR